MALFRGSIACDSCSQAFDGDPISLLGQPTYGLTNAAKVKELSQFWLCAECVVYYPKGAKDFFIPDYFHDTFSCAECGLEDVEEDGHLCDDCLDRE